MRVKVSLTALAIVGLVPALALAQAWIPTEGQLSTFIGYQYMTIGDHLFSLDIPESDGGDGSNGFDLGDITSQTTVLGFDYGLTSRLAASATGTFVASKYEGNFPEDPELDNGDWNSGLQDIAFGLRYVAVRAPVVITPSVGYSTPSHSYETAGHTAIGRDLTEFRMGVNVGWVARSALEGIYLQGGYSYAVVEDISDFSMDRSDATAELGYFVTQNLIVAATGSRSYVHDGVDWATADFGAVGHIHDQAAQARSTTVGGALSYSLGPTAVNFGFIKTIDGENTHDATSILFSISRGFTVRR